MHHFKLVSEVAVSNLEIKNIHMVKKETRLFIEKEAPDTM